MSYLPGKQLLPFSGQSLLQFGGHQKDASSGTGRGGRATYHFDAKIVILVKASQGTLGGGSGGQLSMIGLFRATYRNRPGFAFEPPSGHCASSSKCPPTNFATLAKITTKKCGARTTRATRVELLELPELLELSELLELKEPLIGTDQGTTSEPLSGVFTWAAVFHPFIHSFMKGT